VQDYVVEVLAARKQVCAALDELGVGYWPSEANFVLARFGNSALKLVADLRERGILVRDRGSEIPGAVRITVGDRAQTTRFITALREVLRR
jgi:histidinol-phosphate aminotransferase